MEPHKSFLHAHRLLLGLAADLFTFGGGAILARDAFNHLKDLQERRTDEEFRRRFPDLPLSDSEKSAAAKAGAIARRGIYLLASGFLFQILSRFADP